jgi:hypothetical protein
LGSFFCQVSSKADVRLSARNDKPCTWQNTPGHASTSRCLCSSRTLCQSQSASSAYVDCCCVTCHELFAYVRPSYESLLCTIVRGNLCQILNCTAKSSCSPWAAWYNTWLLVTLMLKGVVCSFLFLVVASPAVCSAEAGSCGVARATAAARADSLAAASVRARLMTRM